MTENANNDPIGKALGISPIETSTTVKNIIADAHNDSAQNDFELARANIITMVETAQDAIDKLSEIAASSQHPRAFEVLAKLMDTSVQANKSLLDLQTKIREINQSDEPLNSQAKTINNNLFVGSTADLQKMILGMRKDNEDQ